MSTMSAGLDGHHPAEELRPELGLETIREVAARCRACDLWERASQTVFGEGATRAQLMLVGEQPGDKEDLAGHPFVGPAGRILDEALERADIERERVFVTNVVKHFKWRPSGKRRLHERPNPAQIRACRPWLELELDLVRPQVLVPMGATAAQSLLGTAFRVSEDHGRVLPPLTPDGPRIVVTYHPSSILRTRTSEERDQALDALVADLVVAREALAA